MTLGWSLRRTLPAAWFSAFTANATSSAFVVVTPESTRLDFVAEISFASCCSTAIG